MSDDSSDIEKHMIALCESNIKKLEILSEVGEFSGIYGGKELIKSHFKIIVLDLIAGTHRVCDYFKGEVTFKEDEIQLRLDRIFNEEFKEYKKKKDKFKVIKIKENKNGEKLS